MPPPGTEHEGTEHEGTEHEVRPVRQEARQVGRAERVVGEVWRVRVGTGRDSQGRDGPWKGTAESRRKRTRGVSKWGGGGRNIRLDAAALGRRVRGLASGGDG